LVALAVGVLVAALATINLRAPKVFSLSTPAAAPAASPSGVPSADPLSAACGSAGPVGKAAGLAGTWVVEPGSQAGYRAHEKFAVLESPHEAVARTPRVAGVATIRRGTGSYRLEGACFVVELAGLTSQDSVPGFDTSDRDGTVREMLSTAQHPYATFRIDPVELPASAGAGQLSGFTAPGRFEVNGVERPASAKIDARLSGDQIQIAGSLPVDVLQHGVDVPTGADFVSVDPHITVEFSLILGRPPSG
jgi:hypothetical protein